ncbi:helix-turn-helix transcriptional regulator [Nonomuraea sp. NPDC050663]|uniref:helix-turn-helix transcriptional regulator n=1 Tax=Nonomuraea sp. NPDC050663 TaxID=3364370 RepID=UPI0037B5337F
MQASDIAALAALDEPTRRELYDFVVRQHGPVSRDEAAEALGLPRSTVVFHLDRLAAQGLLEVVHERRSGRSGPGAGRPSKLYRRSSRSIAVSLPGREYELAGQLLAAAVQEADDTGVSPRVVLERLAGELGRDLGRAARSDHATAVEVLERHGFEPRADGSTIILGNCPFHALAQQHTALVCGMNLCLLSGLLDGIGDTGLTARLQPEAGHCCVRLEAEA